MPSTVAPRPDYLSIVLRGLLPDGGTLLSDDTLTRATAQRPLTIRTRDLRMMGNGLMTTSPLITILITTTTPTFRRFPYVNGPTLTALMSPRL